MAELWVNFIMSVSFSFSFGYSLASVPWMALVLGEVSDPQGSGMVQAGILWEGQSSGWTLSGLPGMLISAEYPSSHTSSPSIGSILLSTRHPPSLGEALQVCSLALPAPTLVLRGMFACSPCSVRSCRGLSEAVHLLCLAPHPCSSPPGLLGHGGPENSRMWG